MIFQTLLHVILQTPGMNYCSLVGKRYRLTWSVSPRDDNQAKQIRKAILDPTINCFIQENSVKTEPSMPHYFTSSFPRLFCGGAYLWYASIMMSASLPRLWYASTMLSESRLWYASIIMSGSLFAESRLWYASIMISGSFWAALRSCRSKTGAVRHSSVIFQVNVIMRVFTHRSGH